MYPRLGPGEEGDAETPVGTGKKRPKKSLLFLLRGPEKEQLNKKTFRQQMIYSSQHHRKHSGLTPLLRAMAKQRAWCSNFVRLQQSSLIPMLGGIRGGLMPSQDFHQPQPPLTN